MALNVLNLWAWMKVKHWSYVISHISLLSALRRDIWLKWHLVGKYAVSNANFFLIVEISIELYTLSTYEHELRSNIEAMMFST